MNKLICTTLLLAAAPALADDDPIAAEQQTNKPGDGLYVSDTGIDVTFQTTTVGTKFGDGKNTHVESAKQTRFSDVSFWVWGASDSTASFVLSVKAGGSKKLGSFHCRVPDLSSETQRKQVRCESDEGKSLSDRWDLQIGPGVHAIDIGLEDAETKKVKPLRTITFKLASAPLPNEKGRTQWFLDRDHLIGEHMAMWLTPTDLALMSWVKTDKTDTFGKAESQVLKCTLDGKPFAPQNAKVAGYVTTPEGKQISLPDDKTTGWYRMTGHIQVSRAKAAGAWECKAFAGGKLWRTFKLVVGEDGAIAKPAQQSQIIAPSVYLPETVIAAGADAKYDGGAFKARGFWGKPLH